MSTYLIITYLINRKSNKRRLTIAYSWLVS